MPSEWLCSKHWPLVAVRLKRRKRKAERLLRIAAARGRETGKFEVNAWAAWRACTVNAIERAAGIA